MRNKTLYLPSFALSNFKDFPEKSTPLIGLPESDSAEFIEFRSKVDILAVTLQELLNKNVIN